MILKTSKKIFVHVDCDSFFASCEVLRNPKLKGKFVCVGGEIILACTYNAKALGIKTGTPVWEAKRILKNNGVFLEPDMLYYQDISFKLMNYLRYNTLSIEEYSVDEAFCEITGLAELNKISIEEYISKIQKEILKEIGIPVSIGVSNTRIKAKIFSKINKPYGYYVSIHKDKELFSKLPISIIPYIGKSYQNKLQYKANNVYEFIQIGYWKLKELIGKNATDLWLELNGVNAFIIKKNKQIKSMSRGRSFNKKITNNKDFLLKQLIINFNILFDEFINKDLEVKNVSIFLRDKNFVTHIYKYSLLEHSYLRTKIFNIIKELFDSNFDKKNNYRSTGIIFSDFRTYKPYQISIFDKKIKDKTNYLLLSKTINNINTKYFNKNGGYKKNIISYGTDLLGKDTSLKLGIIK